MFLNTNNGTEMEKNRSNRHRGTSAEGGEIRDKDVPVISVSCDSACGFTYERFFSVQTWQPCVRASVCICVCVSVYLLGGIAVCVHSVCTVEFTLAV